MVAEELGVLIEQQQRTHSQRLSYSDRFGRHMVRRLERRMVHCLVRYLVHCLVHVVSRSSSAPPFPVHHLALCVA